MSATHLMHELINSTFGDGNPMPAKICPESRELRQSDSGDQLFFNGKEVGDSCAFELYLDGYLISIVVWDKMYCLDIILMVDDGTEDYDWTEVGACGCANEFRARFQRMVSWLEGCGYGA